MKTKEEIRELMKENFEEINGAEFLRYGPMGHSMFCCHDGIVYFKPKEKFPKVFEDNFRKVRLFEDGTIEISAKTLSESIIINGSIPLLEKAIEESKRIRGVK